MSALDKDGELGELLEKVLNKDMVEKLLDDDETKELCGEGSEERKTGLEKKLEKLMKGKGHLLGGDSGATLEGFKKFLRNKLGEGKEKPDDKKALSSDARAIHAANVIRIHKLIDKIEKYGVDCDVELCDSPRVPLPENDEWDFKLGDKVVIDLPLGEFRLMQKQFHSWKKQLSNVRGQFGFVTDIRSKYEGSVQVYFPNIFTSTAVYAGTLTKTIESFHDVASRWKVGDFVKTKKSKELVKKFQKRLPDIPDKHIGKRGRVIGVTNAGIFVTYNERKSYAVNAALLHVSDDTSPIEIIERNCHPMKFRIGDKVVVLKDIKKLIENQKESGGWNWKMSSLVGKTVTITYINKDGSLNVALKNSRSWRINYESVYKDEHGNPFDCCGDLPFMPGDKACFRLVENIKIQLAEAKVLESCLDFLKLPGEVVGIDDDYDVVVLFNNDKKRTMKATSLRKATRWEEERYDAIESKRICLKKGDLVRLDVGPPRYVKNILEKMRVNKTTSDCLTQTAELLGFLTHQRAVIRYKDGRKIQINRKYLVPSEKYEPATPRKADFEILYQLMNIIQSSVEAIHFERSDDPEDDSVDIYSVTSGSPPTVCFRVASNVATPQMIFDRVLELAESKWHIKTLSENECVVNPGERVGQEVHLVLISFAEDPSAPKVKDVDELTYDDSSEGQKHYGREILRQRSLHPDLGAEPFPYPDPLAAAVAPQHAELPPPEIDGWGAFKFLTFHTTGGSLYFPYVPQNYGQAPNVQMAQNEQAGVRGAIHNNFTIHGDVTRLVNNNNA